MNVKVKIQHEGGREFQHQYIATATNVHTVVSTPATQPPLRGVSSHAGHTTAREGGGSWFLPLHHCLDGTHVGRWCHLTLTARGMHACTGGPEAKKASLPPAAAAAAEEEAEVLACVSCGGPNKKIDENEIYKKNNLHKSISLRGWCGVVVAAKLSFFAFAARCL